MDPHSLCKLATASITPPVVPGTKKWQTFHDKQEETSPNTSTMRNFYLNDTLEVDQPEPRNFRKVGDVERTGLQDFTVNRDTLTAEFYGKLQNLKKEHQKTLSLLNQYYEQSADVGRCHSSLGSYDNQRRRKINHLVPDYLDYTENNTFLHDATPNYEPDVVPGYSKRDFQVRFRTREKSDSDKDDASSLSADSAKLNGDEVTSNADSAEVISQMWDEFSLDDYVERENRRPMRKKLPIRPQSAPPKKREWSPIITIPKPFSMTLREAKKKEKSHTRSSVEVSLRQQMKEEEEALERSKKTRAREPPAHIYLPLYEEIRERQEQRSRFNKENSAATLVATQKPFSFAERDEQRLKLKKEKLKEKDKNEFRKIKKMTKFEANPVPYSVHDPSVSDKLTEDQLYRKIKIKLRSEDTMKSSALPPRMHAHELMAQDRRRKWQRDAERHMTYSFRPQTHDVPDFDALHKREELETLARKGELETTTVEPFDLKTSARSKKRQDVREQEMRRMQESWEEENRSRQKYSSGRISALSDTIPARMTDAARLRIDNMRKSLQEADYVISKAKEEERDRNERRRILAQRVNEKATMNDTSASLAETQDEKLRKYKKELRERQLRYNKFLQDVKQRVDERPLLFEQHNEKMAKIQAEKRYREILETSGLSDDFVENKSRLSTGSDGFEPLTSHDLRSTNDSDAFDNDSDDDKIASVVVSKQRSLEQKNDSYSEEFDSSSSSEEEETKVKDVDFA